MDSSTGIKASASPSKNLSSWLRFKSNKSNDSIPKTSRNKNDENAQNSESGIGSVSMNYLRPPPPPHSSSPQQQQQQQQQTSPQKSRPSFTKSFSSGAQKVIPMVRSPLFFKGDNDNTPANTNSTGSKKIFAYKQFRDDFLKDKHQFQGQVFGVSLEESLKTSSAEVILQSEQVFFGRIPTVVAKCGSFLKKNALDHQGIFRIAGNNKRVKNLQFIFSEPPSYGLSFDDWYTNGYTVHDAATILRRYLNNLEEPLIPLKFYDKFREPLEKRPRILKNMKKGNSNFFTKQQEIELKLEKIQLSTLSSTEKNQPDIIEKRKANLNKRKLIKDIRSCLKEYKENFLELLNNDDRQLLIYLLDLLSLFAQHSEKNLMSSKNLAAIFQPSILSHPDHDMNPSQYELSRYCVEFLIDFSYKLLPHILNIPKDKLKHSSTGSQVTKSSNVSEEQEKENENESQTDGGNDLEKFPADENEGSNVVVQGIGSNSNINTHKRTASRPYSKSLSAKPNAVHDVLRIVNSDPKHGSEQEEDDDEDEDDEDEEFADDSDIVNVTNGSVDEHNNTTIDYQDYMNGLGFEPINFVSSPMGSTGVQSGANLIISPVTSNASSSIRVGSQSKSETLLSRPPPPHSAVYAESETSQIAIPIPKIIKTSELLNDMPGSSEKTPRLKKRESWFQKLRSQSSF